jgi:hypothetical protein
LTKARVTTHSFSKELANRDIQDGLNLAGKTLQEVKPRWRSVITAATAWD